jgi:hypothetical protein
MLATKQVQTNLTEVSSPTPLTSVLLATDRAG